MKRQLVIPVLSLASLILFSAPIRSELYIEESKPIEIFITRPFNYQLTNLKYLPIIDQQEAWIYHMYLKESSCDWTEINKTNHIGGWQFGRSTLKRLGYGHITPYKFKRNPNIFPLRTQLQAVKSLMRIHEMELEPYMGYVVLEREIKGVRITKAGLLAGAHLGGAGGVKLFLTSNGEIDLSDGHTRISDYIKEFSIYDF